MSLGMLKQPTLCIVQPRHDWEQCFWCLNIQKHNVSKKHILCRDGCMASRAAPRPAPGRGKQKQWPVRNYCNTAANEETALSFNFSPYEKERAKCKCVKKLPGNIAVHYCWALYCAISLFLQQYSSQSARRCISWDCRLLPWIVNGQTQDASKSLLLWISSGPYVLHTQ